ncbi:MAG: gamma-glutamyl-gamma-aminobutyrate hydrolase family protein [bacterium]|nr:gamma-glutamyl-gamma-aminobutyrate hydrolase family protein [bacterium]
MTIAIAGKTEDVGNYVRYTQKAHLTPLVTLDAEKAAACDALILPGGGDITPAFFGEKNRGSKNIDTALDILQLQILSRFLSSAKPILGICKGMQLVNVGLGGTVIQDMETAQLHRYEGGDQYHATRIDPASFLGRLYGDRAVVNSAHHQAIGRPGRGLRVIQRCEADGCPEAVVHETLPVLGLQWHPERIDNTKTTLSGGNVLTYFVSLIPSSRQ